MSTKSLLLTAALLAAAFTLGRVSVLDVSKEPGDLVLSANIGPEKHGEPEYNNVLILDASTMDFLREEIRGAVTQAFVTLDDSEDVEFEGVMNALESEKLIYDEQLQEQYSETDAVVVHAREWMENRISTGEVTHTNLAEFQNMIGNIPTDQKISLLSELHKKINNQELSLEHYSSP